MNDTNECLEAASQVLWRCVALGVLFLMIWAVMYMLAGKMMTTQCEMFGLSAQSCGVVHYAGMGMVKCSIILFFLTPYIAIRMVLAKRKK